MFGQSKPKNSDCYNAIVSAHIFIDEKERKSIEILDIVQSDDEFTDIFCDIEDMLIEEVEIGEKEQHFFMAHIRAWFHSYYDYHDGHQAEVESDITELKNIADFANLKFNHE